GENETIKQKLINTGFLANFEYTQDQSNPLKMHFSDTSIGEEASWEWDFGDGNTSTSQHPTHTFDTPGRFNITLTISKGEWSSKYSKYILISVSGYRLISSYDLQGKEVWYSKNGKFAYAATNSWFIETDHTLDLLSLEDPSNIKLLSKIVFDNEKNLENKILDVTELKNRIFVHHACKGQYYLSVIDSSTPQSPIILHEIPVDKGLFDVQNSYIYLVTINDDGFLHVTVFDITNEITQIISQPFEEHQPYTLFDMALNGNTAWLMLKSDETKYALVPLDVSDSTNIALLPHEEIEKGSSYDNFGKIVIEQDIAYVMTGNYYDNLFIVDVSNPRNIQYYKEIPGLWPIL
ncbi:MAG: PKD domain-containing protein, partial [Spirochaetales bacterium]|nr:PKD domain-containing protein [Spirochaetales bacterium]